MRDPSSVDAKLVTLVRELSRRAGRPSTDDEARAALSPLSTGELETLFAFAQGEPPAKPLGPMAWADMARGTPAQTAAARELTGYYGLQLERDALAQVLQAKGGKAPAPKKVTKAFSGDWDDDDRDGDDREAAEIARVRAGHGDERSVERDEEEDEPAPRQVVLRAKPVEPKPIPRDRRARAIAGDEEKSGQILTLFAYHRDTPLVAKALGWSLAELEEEVDRLGLKRKVGKELRGLDTEMPVALVRKSKSDVPVRRRSAKEKAEAAARVETSKALAKLAAEEEAKAAQAAPAEDDAPTRSRRLPGKALKSEAGSVKESARPLLARPGAIQAKEKQSARGAHAAAPEKRERLPVRPSAEQGEELRAILREVGPRRGALAARLGSGGKPLSAPALLARFRAAGLEREFGQRERDLIRALVSRHKSALGPAAVELGVSKHELESLIRERGLAKEVEEQREQKRRAARSARWPKAQLAQLLEKQDWLADLGVYDELEDEVRAKVKVLWKELAERPSKAERLAALADSLGLKPAEAQLLSTRLALH